MLETNQFCNLQIFTCYRNISLANGIEKFCNKLETDHTCCHYKQDSKGNTRRDLPSILGPPARHSLCVNVKLEITEDLCSTHIVLCQLRL